jgi:hypothetical protein
MASNMAPTPIGTLSQVFESGQDGLSFYRGIPQPRVLALHVLPNVLGGVVVLASLWTASAIHQRAVAVALGGRPAPGRVPRKAKTTRLNSRPVRRRWAMGFARRGLTDSPRLPYRGSSCHGMETQWSRS